MKVRKTPAWRSCNKLNKIWQAPLSKSLKLRTFLTLVESVFLYGTETWTLPKSLEKSIDRTYTRLLRMAFIVSWSEHGTNSGLAIFQKFLRRLKFKSSRPGMFLGKCVLKICSKFTGEHLSQSTISVKLKRNFIEITLLYDCSSSCKFAAYFQNTFS